MELSMEKKEVKTAKSSLQEKSATQTQEKTQAVTKPATTKVAESENAAFTDVQTLLTWTGPGRPFRKHSHEFYANCLLIMLAIEIILFLFSQIALMAVVLALVFAVFALVSIPPHDSRYRISTEGVGVDEYFFLWQELYDFYFQKRSGAEVLIITTQSLFPGELVITLGSMSKEEVKSVLLPYLPYREFVKKVFMEKAGDWLERTFPLEKTS